MDKQEFYQFIKERIHNYLPDDYQQAEVMIQDVQVSEGITKAGLILVMKDREQVPVLNLESYYEEAQVDAVKEDVLEGLAKDYVGMCEGKPRLPFVKMTAEEFYGRLHTTVINFEDNKQELSNMPYFKLYDMAIIPMIAFDEQLSRPVSLTHARAIGISGAAILQEAMKNHAKIYPPTLKRALEENSGISILSQDAEPINNTDSYFELTNAKEKYGAAMMSDPETLAGIRKLLGADFYMLVNSIHDVTVLSEHFGYSLEKLQETVMNYNAGIPKDLILSNHVFYYSGESKSLEVYKGETSKEKKLLHENRESR